MLLQIALLVILRVKSMLCLCSQSWRMGPSLCAQGSGKEGVPQVPQALHLLRPGKDC